MQHRPQTASANMLSLRAVRLRSIISSLIAFLFPGVWPRTPLAKAVVLVLVIKLAGIAGMKVFLFPQNSTPAVDETAMARVIGISAHVYPQ